ncbi:MAG: hypothetical protein OXP28_11635 [Gammaproteobacteria bacterium]|nr:hypothetical protein [Gammaproteobacteria bacterium]
MIARRQLLAAGAVAPWIRTTSAVADADVARLLIDTRRQPLLESLVARIRSGLRPEQLLRGLAIAACREVSPYPHVGFRYHAVMMLRSVELSVAGMPDERRWLPLLWTANYFKSASGQQDHFRPWSLPAIAETSGGLPELEAALAAWDRDAADRAAHGMVMGGDAGSALQTLMLHAARDFRAIGHKTIAAANAHRLCRAFGDDRLLAEPVVRSLALAVQNPQGDDFPAGHEYLADHDWKTNRPIGAALPGNWSRGREDLSAARTLLQELRTASSETAVTAAADLLEGGISADTVWEAVAMFAAEMVLRRNDIVAVHANTTAEAMRYCYEASDADAARRMLILQAVAFMPRFRELTTPRPGARDRRIDTVEPAAAGSLDEVFETLGRSRYNAVRQALGWLDTGGSPVALADRLRWYATLKNRGTHDIKFTEAMLENYRLLRFGWRNRLLAASLMYANASRVPDDETVVRAQSLLQRATGTTEDGAARI